MQALLQGFGRMLQGSVEIFNFFFFDFCQFAFFGQNFITIKSEKMDPICLHSFNDARECLFKADGNTYNCKTFMNEFVHCQKDPVEFRAFLEAATKNQKKPKKFDFVAWRGYFDRHQG